MQCSEAQGLLNSYIDGELAPAAAMRVESHVGRCNVCRVQVQELQAVNGALGAEDVYYSAPGPLRSRMESLIQTGAPLPVKNPAKIIAGLFAGVAFTLAIVAGIIMVRPTAVVRTPAELTMESHLRAVSTGRLTEIESSDARQIKNWLQQKGIELPVVSDYSKKGFTLIGARLERFQTQQIPVLVYANGGQFVSIYHWPGPCAGAHCGCLGEMCNQRMIQWRKENVDYIAVSDMAMEQLETLASLVGVEAKQ